MVSVTVAASDEPEFSDSAGVQRLPPPLPQGSSKGQLSSRILLRFHSSKSLGY